MLCYTSWKEFINETKKDINDNFTDTCGMLALILFTPILFILDIIIFPYSICYLIVYLIKKGGKK